MTPTVAVTRSSRTGNATYTSFDATGIVDGDLLLILMCWDTGTVTPTMPSGYTDMLGGTQTIGTRRAAVYRKIASSEPSAYTGLGTTAASGKTTTLVAIRNWSGTLTDLVIGTFLNRATYGGTGYVNQASAITTTHTNNLVLNLSFEATSAADTVTPTVSSGTLVHWSYPTAAGTETNVVSTSSVTTSGTSVGPIATTYQNIQASNGGAVLLSVAGGAAPPPPSGLAIKYKSSGGLTDANLYVVGASGPKAPTSVVKLKPGYPSVSNMLGQTTFSVAHRGGSRSFPEMSLYAYTHSVICGYGALEISLARTSDGVWFGLHDATLDRTSGVTGVTASALTWAQVQTYNILGSTASDNPSQPNRPYMRWEELIAAYYGTHIIFVDPKNALSYRTEILNMMDALPNPTSHFVAKYYGVEGNAAGTTGWAHDSSARGYQGWGYFYEADVANIPTYQGRWSILGMDYTASQSAWDAALSYGKLVIGHICPDNAAVATAFSKGAYAVMVSGTASVTAPKIA